MTNLKRDENGVTTVGAVSELDGTTVIPIAASVDFKLKVNIVSTGANNGGVVSGHDENHETTLIGVSATDGVTPIPIYADANGFLLVTS